MAPIAGAALALGLTVFTCNGVLVNAVGEVPQTTLVFSSPRSSAKVNQQAQQ